MSAIKSVVIVGGSGKIAVELTRRLLARQPPPQITSIIRSTTSPSFKSLEELPHYNTDVLNPVISSLESSTVQEFVNIFKQAKADVVVFSAGAGGKTGSDGISSSERTKKVDYEGAVKVFDALELVQEHGLNPRLVLVSTIDCRDLNITPPHYKEADLEFSKVIHNSIGEYMRYKYLADKDLVGRTKFNWTILRPGPLTNEPAIGLAECGIAPFIGLNIPRADVAHGLDVLLDRTDAHGLSLDLVKGNTQIKDAIDKAIKDRANAWVG